MWKCPRCGERNGDEAPACANCAGGPDGRPAAPEAPEAALPPGRVKIWSTGDPVKAELMRVLLAREGIDAVLVRDWGVHYAVGLGSSVLAVGGADAERARQLIAAEDALTAQERYVPPVAMLSFPCSCGKTLEVPPDFQGIDMDCPYCGKPLQAG